MIRPKRNNRKFQFGSKAETLEQLKPLLEYSHVPDFFYFTVSQWENKPYLIIEKAKELFGETEVIVRSSTRSEDGENISMAGIHTTVSGICVADTELLSRSINKVISSFKKGQNGNNPKDQVLIQHMINDVSMSGVVFTQDMNTGAPYYVINYDDQSSRTDTVTSGGQAGNKTLLVHREATNDINSPRFKALVQSVQEIEIITGYDSLDIEYAVGIGNKVYLFQVRKITTSPNWNREITLRVNDAVKRVCVIVADHFKRMQYVYGNRSILARMSDWNPAEMIGIAPRPLAFSLYRRLITDSVWRDGRAQMGYLAPKGAPLMVSLAGQPYIDVRLSFNSFLPADLDPSISEQLVNAWIDRLFENEEFHDKVEFEVAITVLDFNFDKTMEQRFPWVLNANQIRIFKRALFRLTDGLLSGRVSSIDGELKKIEQLERQRKSLLKNNSMYDIATVSALLDDCVKLGTLPFSIIARHAFIAKSLMRSLIERGGMDESDSLAFQKSIKTVAGEMLEDIENLGASKVTPEEFMAKYGHLRPGTYDILSLRYDQREDLLRGLIDKPIEPAIRNNFSFSQKHIRNVELLLKETGYDITPDVFFTYVRNAITAREYAKFAFTKNISASLEIVAHWGEQIGLSRDDLSYMTIQDILDGINDARGRTIEQHLGEKSLTGRNEHEVTVAVRLPYILKELRYVSVIPLLQNMPNFITNKVARGTYIFLSGHNLQPSDVANKIVLIESADPGFDWIFSCSVTGLVTKYGGANSHMAIRCAEFGLPAAIGCGEQIFDLVLRGSAVELNCSEELIIPMEG